MNFEVSARTKRTLLRVGLPAAVLLGAGGVAYANLPHTFAPGEVLTAASLNTSFQSLDTRVTALEGHGSEASGSRLVARYTTTTQVGADGAQQVTKTFAGWFDTQRNEYCFTTPASDGQQRCLPSDTGDPGPLSVGSASSGVFFADAACSLPIIQVQLNGGCTSNPACSACNPPAPRYFRSVYSTCGGGTPSTSPGTHLYPVGAKLSLSNVYVAHGGEAPCA